MDEINRLCSLITEGRKGEFNLCLRHCAKEKDMNRLITALDGQFGRRRVRRALRDL
jgi:hypothetical protein